MNTLDSSASSPPTPSASRSSAPSPARESLHLRALRSTALIALALALTLLFSLWLLSRPALFSVAEAIGDLVGRGSPTPDHSNRPAAFVIVGLLALLPVALTILASRFRLRSWWWIGGGWLAVLPVFVYLATDEPLRGTLTLEEMAPAFPGAENSYAVLMRYGKQHPVPEALALEKLPLKIVGWPPAAGTGDSFVKFLTERRSDIEADWAALAPQRRWLDELNAFDRIGDLGTASIDADVVRFSVWRLLSQRSAAQAGLLALDGRGDEAIATLLPVLEVARKLEPSSRTLLRFMVSRAVQSLVIDVAAFTLKRTAVSAPLRARLAAALKLGVGGEPGARRLVAIDYAGSSGWISTHRLGEIVDWNNRHGPERPVLNLLSPFLYNPHRTVNRYGELVAELQELAARRDTGKIAVREVGFWNQEGRPAFKNFYGRAVSLLLTPALSKLVASYWKIEDKRTALLAQLTQK